MGRTIPPVAPRAAVFASAWARRTCLCPRVALGGWAARRCPCGRPGPGGYLMILWLKKLVKYRSTISRNKAGLGE